MATLVIKAGTIAQDTLIKDLGYVIPAGGSVTLTTDEEIRFAQNSKDLLAYVTDGRMVLNDGSADVTAAAATRFLKTVLMPKEGSFSVGKRNASGEFDVTMTFDGSATILGLPLPQQNSEAANKEYVDTVLNQSITSLNYKESVRVVMDLGTHPAGDPELSGLPMVDGVQLIDGDRVLVNYSGGTWDKTFNGIYVAGSGSWVRTDDLSGGDFAKAALVIVEEGTLRADESFVCVNDAGSDVVGVDGLTFSLFSTTKATKITLDGTYFNGDLEPGSSVEDAISMISDEIYNVDTGLRALIADEQAAREAADENFNAALASEEASRIAGDTALQNALNTEISDRQTAVSQLSSSAASALSGAMAAEVASRIAADEALQDALDAEEARALAAEGVLQGNIDAEESARIAGDAALSGALASEIARATDAEATLQSNIDAEEARALAAEGVLQSNIDAEEARAIAAEGVLSGALAQEIADRVSAINQAYVDMDSMSDDLYAAIATEEAARIAGDTALSGALDTEKARALAAEAVLSGALAAEIGRATDAEATLQSNIDNLELQVGEDLSALSSSFYTSLEENVIALQGADNDLEALIESEVENRIVAVGNLSSSFASSLATETAAREAADATETENRISADLALQGQINDEVATRTSEVTRLDGEVTRLDGRVDAAIDYASMPSVSGKVMQLQHSGYVNGVQYLSFGDVPTSAAPVVMMRPGYISAASIVVDNADASKDYKVSFKKFDGVSTTEMGSMPLVSGSQSNYSVDPSGDFGYMMKFAAGDMISVSVEETSGVGGFSTFANVVANVEICEALDADYDGGGESNFSETYKPEPTSLFSELDDVVDGE